MKSLDISASPARAAGEPSPGWHCPPNSTQAQTFFILGNLCLPLWGSRHTGPQDPTVRDQFSKKPFHNHRFNWALDSWARGPHTVGPSNCPVRSPIVRVFGPRGPTCQEPRNLFDLNLILAPSAPPLPSETLKIKFVQSQKKMNFLHL